MSHEIYKDDSMFSVIEVPWHKLGKILESHPVTSQAAIIEAGLNWEVELEPVFLKNGKEIENHFATVRQDTRLPLGIVGNKYQIVSNKSAFSFFDEVLQGESGFYETAGSLKHGRIIWALMRLPETIVIRRDKFADPVKEYLLLTSTHDGTGAVKALMTPVRVVCNNTLSLALSNAQFSISARHTTNAPRKLAEASEKLGIVRNNFASLGDMFQKLAETKMGTTDFERYVKFVLPLPINTKEEDISTRLKNSREKILEIYDSSKALNGFRGTYWGGYNSVTEYADHFASGKKEEDAKLHSIWLGSKAEVKSRALALAVSGAQNNGFPADETFQLNLSKVELFSAN